MARSGAFLLGLGACEAAPAPDLELPLTPVSVAEGPSGGTVLDELCLEDNAWE